MSTTSRKVALIGYCYDLGDSKFKLKFDRALAEYWWFLAVRPLKGFFYRRLQSVVLALNVVTKPLGFMLAGHYSPGYRSWKNYHTIYRSNEWKHECGCFDEVLEEMAKNGEL